MNVPGLGALKNDEDFDALASEPVALNAIFGQSCKVYLEEFEEDDNPDEFLKTVQNFLSIGPDVLRAAEPHIFKYYEDVKTAAADDDDDEDIPDIASPADVWNHIELGDRVTVQRRPYDGQEMFVSIEGECDWDEEHGIQIVFKDGLTVNKVGPFDDFLTNADSYDDPAFEDVIYVDQSMLGTTDDEQTSRKGHRESTTNMDVPGLGTLELDENFDALASNPVAIKAIFEHECKVYLEEFEDDENPDEFLKTVQNFLSIGPDVLRAAEPHIYKYYQEMKEQDDDDEIPNIDAPANVWNHIELGDRVTVQRRPYEEQEMFVSIEGECDWDEEHGIQIVFKDGLTVTKVGPFDDFMSNADAYDDPSVKDVIYVDQSMIEAMDDD